MNIEEFADKLKNAHDKWSHRKNEVVRLLDSRPILLAGYGGKGQALADHIQRIVGKRVTILDKSSDKRRLATTKGFEVLDTLETRQASQWAVVLGACQEQIEQNGQFGKNTIFYQEAASVFEAPHLAHMALEFEKFTLRQVQDLYDVYKKLHHTSKNRFFGVLCFRLSNDPNYLKSVRQPVAEMWLDIPTIYKKREYKTFLDVGAFDGDTLKCFRSRFNCSRGIAVEANKELLHSIRSIASLYPQGIQIMPAAAWSRATRLAFDEVRNGMIQVTENESGQIDAAPIDSHVNESVDCIKIDIEGAEAEALAGGANLLATYQPDLAIAAYHRPEDLVVLYNKISTMGYQADNFDWHFGHYSDCLDDSIFYVLRKN